jgi:hypothetical protein
MITTRQDLARAIEDIGCTQEEPGGTDRRYHRDVQSAPASGACHPEAPHRLQPGRKRATACTTDGYEPVINEYVNEHSFGHLKRRFATNGCV